MTQSSPKLTEEERKAIAIEAYADPVFFCTFFLKHMFPVGLPWMHRGLLAILLGRCNFLEKYGNVEKIINNFVVERDNEVTPLFYYENDELKMVEFTNILVMLPRGCGKTTLAGVAAPLMEVVYEDCPFSIILSESGSSAANILESVKRELEGNQALIEVYGNLVPELRDAQRWRETEIEATNGCVVYSKGRGGQVRGQVRRGVRPGKIIVDDLEDEESVKNDEQRRKTREWAFRVLLPALDVRYGRQVGKLVAVGTLLHNDALLTYFQRDPTFAVVRFGVYDKDGDNVFPYKYSNTYLEKMKSQFHRAGMLEGFYLEFYNEDRPGEAQLFKPEYFGGIHEPFFDYTNAITAVYWDPAFSKRRTADDTAIVVWAKRYDGVFHKLDEWGGIGIDPADALYKFFEFSVKYQCTLHGFENQAAQASLEYMINEFKFRFRNLYKEREGVFPPDEYVYFEPIGIPHKTSKELRIIGVLNSLYHGGRIRHCRHFKSETQALDYRRGMDQHDDYIDADSACIGELLDPTAALSSGSERDEDFEINVNKKSLIDRIWCH